MAYNIPGISGIDTRALTRHIRAEGAMMGMLTSEMTAEEALLELKKLPRYDSVNFVKQVSTGNLYQWECSRSDDRSVSLPAQQSTPNIVVVDLGLKYSVPRILAQLGCQVTIVPCSTSAEDIESLRPDGIILSSGPGDPAYLDDITDTVKKLLGKKPVMGICMGLQLIARASGAKSFKLKFGHRGGNHPVRDLATGKVYITAQNHGYAIDADTLKGGLEVSHINLNDGTVEGLTHRDLPILAIQYHSEAAPGPLDSMYLFDRFLEMVRG